MLRLLFKTNEEEPKQLTVITDGIDSQLNVFVTENTVGDIDYFESLGIVIEPGRIYNIGSFKEWAMNNALQLISYPEGLNDEAQVLVDVVEEWKYFLIPQKETLEFPKEGDSIEAVVTSYKQLYVNGKPQGNQTALSVKFQTEAPFTVSEGGTVTINENPSDTVRNGNLTITQDESGKTLNIVLSQEASIITYNYILTTNPSSLSFINTGETKSINVTSTKQKVINGTPSGETIKALVTVELAGVGFSYEETDNGYDITVTENPGETQRTGTLTINQTDEGGKSVSVNLTQAASVITYDYTLTATPTSLSFANTGETKSFSVVSTKQKKLNGNVSGSAVDVAFSFEVAGSGFSKSTGNNVVATENTTESERTGVVTITQSESDEVDTINLSQTAATVTYDYTLTTDPTSLSFVAAGETKVFGVTSNKQKKVNGKNSGSPIVVDYTTVVSGEGFTKGSSEYSVIAATNTGAERTGQAVVTANEGGKTAIITLTQLGV